MNERLTHNGQKSADRKKVMTWTHKSLTNKGRKSDDRKKVMTWTHKSLYMEAQNSWTSTQNSLANALKGGHVRRKVWWMHGSPAMNADWPNMIAKTSGLECTKFGTWADEILIINALESGERKIVWRMPGNLEKHAKNSDESTEVWKSRNDRLKMNVKKSGEDKKVWQSTQDCHDMSSRTSETECTMIGLQRTKIWWTQKIMNTKKHQLHMNARKSAELTNFWTWTNERLIKNGRKSADRNKVMARTQKSLYMEAQNSEH